MHSRLVAEGKPGSGMRSRANYSIWFNGNLRTTGYFHNQIGLLTEIKGNPTPMELAFYPDRQLMSNDMPFPHEPKKWHFREAIDYSITLDRAVIDYASRHRETLLYNRYLMGRNSIERGSRDHWTIHPKVVDRVNQAVKKDTATARESAPTFRLRGRGVHKKFYDLFHKPENRDPRGYILPSDQADFPTAAQFVNTFIKNGITAHRATGDFEVVYPRTLDAGKLNKKFDVLVFVTGAIPPGEVNLSPQARSGRRRQIDPESIPRKYRDWLGRVSTNKTVPHLIEFLEKGGTILAIGSSTNLGPMAGCPLGNHIVDGQGEPLSREAYYIPSSILQVRVDNTRPLAYGLKERIDIFFSNSPVFRLHPDADKNGVTPVAWFDS